MVNCNLCHSHAAKADVGVCNECMIAFERQVKRLKFYEGQYNVQKDIVDELRERIKDRWLWENSYED